MVQNICVGILCVVALAAGVWGWWVDNGGTFGKGHENDAKECEECRDEKN